MSFEALAWAAKCRPGSASRKLVLLALADRHNTETGLAYPSIDWLAEFTDLNRKTIISAIDALLSAGFIADSGVRFGRTGQVKAYTLALGEKAKGVQESHYVYRLDADDGSYYLGVRSFVGDVDSDRYAGSGKWPDHMRFNGVKLKKSIVSVHGTRTDADIAEALAIKKCIGDALCMNIEYKDTDKRVPEMGSLNSPKNDAKQSQKRDTDTVRTLSPSTSEDKSSSVETPAFKKDHVIEKWNSLAANGYVKPVRKLTKERDRKLEARMRENSFEDFLEVFGSLERSKFIHGDNPRGWKPTFDFILQPSSFVKLLEGAYDGH